MFLCIVQSCTRSYIRSPRTEVRFHHSLLSCGTDLRDDFSLQSKLAGLSGNSGGDSSSKTNVGAIAGGVVGGLGGLALIVLGFLFYRRRKANNQPRDYEENKGTFATFFSRGGNNTDSRPGNPLDGYHHEPMAIPFPTATSSGFHSQSQVSYQSPTESFGGQPPRMSFSTSNGSTSNSGQQLLPLNPLRLHNGENTDYQAPPLPRKADLARIHTPSMEDVTRRHAHNAALPTSPSVGGSSEASQLRNEVENLRREMEEMRSRTMYEPPPQYT